MATIDLRYWIKHSVLVLRGDLYYPAVIYEANNALSQVFVEIKNGQGLLSLYNNVFNMNNMGLCSIISDISPPYVDIMHNVKVAVRIPYGIHPYGVFAPGFVCDILPECGRFLVRLYSGQESIVGPEDLRLIIPPWSSYSMYYLQRNISLKSEANFFQPEYPTLSNPYYQQEAFHPMQEILPYFPACSEAPKQFLPLSANNFSGCQVVEKENIKTDASDYYNINKYGIDSPYPTLSDSERINQWNNLNAFYENNLSNNYPDVKTEEIKQNILTEPQTQCGPECKDQNCVNAMFKSGATNSENNSINNSNNNSNNNSAPRVKRKYTKRKNVPAVLPKKSSFVPLEQQNLIKTRKPNAFFMFCKEYRYSVTASSFDQSAKHISQKLAEIWGLLPAEEKKKYQDKAKKLEREELIKAEWNRLNKISNNYNAMEPLTINTSYVPGPNFQGNATKTDGPNSYSDDEPRLVIDESRLDEESEDNASPLFIPKTKACAKEKVDIFPDQSNTFLREEDIKREEIKTVMRIECDTTSNFEEKYLSDIKPKTLVGETFFPPDFSVEKVQTDDITILTERITKELFDSGTKRNTARSEKKNDLIIQLFKDNGYYPSDYSIEELLHKNSDIFVDKRRLKNNIREVRQKLLSEKESSYLPLSPQVREILSSVMNNGSPLTTPGFD